MEILIERTFRRFYAETDSQLFAGCSPLKLLKSKKAEATLRLLAEFGKLPVLGDPYPEQSRVRDENVGSQTSVV